MSRKPLTTRSVTPENLVEMVNREIIPYIRQTTPGTAFTGSRAGMTAAELQFLSILSLAGILVDETTP